MMEYHIDDADPLGGANNRGCRLSLLGLLFSLKDY